MREIFIPKNIRTTLTQGSIINHCTAVEYPDCDVFGCIITPRCDLDRDMKVPTVHYLPIVSFEDWYNVYGLERILKITKAQIAGDFKSVAKDILKYPDILELGLSMDDISKLISNLRDKKQIKNISDKYEKYKSCLSLTKEKFKPTERACKDLIKDLINGDLAGYYPIERWQDAGGVRESSDIMIIILREVQTISRDIALKFKSGFIESEFDAATIRNNSLSVSNDNSYIYEIQCEMKSPFIEHVIQAFSHNFCRIGVEDMDKAIADKLLKKINA